MFGSLGGPELFLIFVVGLVVFGPRKLPEIGKSLGKMIGEFKKASADFQRTVEEEVETEKLRKEISSADFTADSPSPEVKPLPEPAPVIREAEGSIPVSSPLAELSEEALPAPAGTLHEGEKS
ncbi:MAG: twin-arginine translocase TatA/TatE family subunit [Vicinamibacteria bacterium]